MALKRFLFLGLSVLLSFELAYAEGEVVVDVTLTPAGDFKAKTHDIQGEVELGEGGSVKAENIVVSLKNLKTGISLRDKHAREKYLEVEKFPEAILVRGVGKDGKGEGILKIKGVEKPVRGTYRIEGDFVQADFQIKLSDYGITGIRYMGIGVKDDVKIHVKVPLKKK